MLIYYNQIDISTCWYDAETESNRPKEKHSRTSDNVIIRNSKHNKNDLNDDAVSTSVVSVDKDQDKVQAPSSSTSNAAAADDDDPAMSSLDRLDLFGCNYLHCKSDYIGPCQTCKNSFCDQLCKLE
jgi:hypothetical protein